MPFLEEPFFWAMISMFGLVGACAIVGSKRIGQHTILGALIVAIFDLGRFVLVLPGLDQARINAGVWFGLAGGVVFLCGGYLGLAPAASIRPLNVAGPGTELVTTGLYGVVRNPIYLGELLLCLGWAMICRSVIGVALVPLWWLGLLILIIIEEESLEHEFGAPYVAYKQRVRGRILPGLPV